MNRVEPLLQSVAPTLTVAVIALNEAIRLDACLEAVKFADEIVVIDAGSWDATVSIAQAHGAKVHVYDDWQGFGEQRTRALTHVSSEFVLWIDADEIVSPTLAVEIKAILAATRSVPDPTLVWAVRWTQMAFGKPMRWYRDNHWNVRLIPKRLLASYTGVVHEAPVWATPTPPSVGRLSQRLAHNTRPSVADSLIKVAQYAALGARKRRQAGYCGGVLRGILAALRIFLLHYFFRGALLSGGRGFVFALLLAQEAFYKYAILALDAEIAIQTRGTPT